MNFKTFSINSFLALFFIIVSIQNVEVIPIHIVFWKVEISKLLIIILTLVIGILIGMMIPGLLKKSPKDEKVEVK